LAGFGNASKPFMYVLLLVPLSSVVAIIAYTVSILKKSELPVPQKLLVFLSSFGICTILLKRWFVS